MEKTKTKIFEIYGVKFCFTPNPNHRFNKLSAKFRLMIYDYELGWRTINYPNNYTEARILAKQYLQYS